MVKKLTAVLLTMCMAVSLLPMFAQAASKPDIKVGDYVKMGTYNNASILWRCVSIDDNGPLMLADRIVDTLAYDAKTNDNSNSKSHSRSYKRADYGSNYWRDSNMRSWLNSTAAAGKVDWLCGNPPKDGYVSGTGAYNNKAGFLNEFSKSEIAAMKPLPSVLLSLIPNTIRVLLRATQIPICYTTPIFRRLWLIMMIHILKPRPKRCSFSM